MTPLAKIYNQLLDLASKNLQKIELNHSDSLSGCDWKNHLYISPSVRYGHVEYFKAHNDKVEVVHCVFFPHYYKRLPIFGYDIIALGGKITGVFCDYTPSPYDVPYLRTWIQKVYEKYEPLSRKLPEWTEFFSKEFISVAPGEKFEEIAKDCCELFQVYLDACYSEIFYQGTVDKVEVLRSIDGQNRYSVNQKKNTKTQKALAAYIGEKPSLEFIHNILFPEYKLVDF